MIIALGTKLPLDGDAAGIRQPRHKVGEVTLHHAELQLVVGADALTAAEGGDPLGERHAIGEIGQQLLLLGVDEGDVLIDQRVEGGTVRQHLLVGHDIGGGVQLAEVLLALQIPGDEHAGGQLGGGNLVVVDETVAHVGGAVRRHHADVAGGVAGEL